VIARLDAHRGRPADRDQRLLELGGLIAAHQDRHADRISGLRLFTTDESGEPTSSIAEASFAFVAQGAKRIAVGDHVVDYGPGDYLIVSIDLPVTGQFTAASKDRPFLGIGLTLDPKRIASVLLDTPDARDAGHVGPRRPALGASSASDELLDALARLLRLLDSPQDRDALAPLIEREILWRLICGPQGHLVRGIGLQSSALAQIGTAVRWIRTHYAEPFRVEDLAEQTAMSPSTFHRHFRTATTMSPIRYQKQIRLQQARLLLVGSGLDVTRIAHTVGYESPSQFSREYHREFGVSPSRDATGAQPGPTAAPAP
jgi:AraC-like DNA-binding protein